MNKDDVVLQMARQEGEYTAEHDHVASSALRDRVAGWLRACNINPHRTRKVVLRDDKYIAVVFKVDTERGHIIVDGEFETYEVELMQPDFKFLRGDDDVCSAAQ